MFFSFFHNEGSKMSDHGFQSASVIYEWYRWMILANTVVFFHINKLMQLDCDIRFRYIFKGLAKQALYHTLSSNTHCYWSNPWFRSFSQRDVFQQWYLYVMVLLYASLVVWNLSCIRRGFGRNLIISRYFPTTEIFVCRVTFKYRFLYV